MNDINHTAFSFHWHKKQPVVYIFNITVSLFIFNAFNREFSPLLDLRYIIFVLMFFLLSLKILRTIQIGCLMAPIRKDTLLLVTLFILLLLVSSLQWLHSDLYLNREVFSNIITLYSYNILAAAIMLMYWRFLDVPVVFRSIFISGLFLCFSMLLILLNKELFFVGSAEAHLQVPVKDPLLRNIFLDRRIAGYAEDANYAAFSMLLWMLCCFMWTRKSIVKIVVFILAGFGLIVSASKTVFLGLILALLFVFLRRKKLLGISIMAGAITTVLLWPRIYEILFYLQTMSKRLRVWRVTLNHFWEHPILGSGISSVRSYFFDAGFWYVQPHSTYAALLVDHGIIGFGIFVLFLLKLLRLKNVFYQILLVVFVVFCINFEVLVFPCPVIVMVLLPLLLLSQQKVSEQQYGSLSPAAT
ncbi:MAG: O-antigen ligase family protein [Planctomycetota bacterium]|jgi:hypothetical protein